MGRPLGSLYSCVVSPSSSSFFFAERPPRPSTLPGPLSLGPDLDLGEREVAGVFRFWRPEWPDGEIELAVERPEPSGERDATLLWLSVPGVEKRGLADRGLLGSRPVGPDDVEVPGSWPRGSSPQEGDSMASSGPSRPAMESSGCWESTVS